MSMILGIIVGVILGYILSKMFSIRSRLLIVLSAILLSFSVCILVSLIWIPIKGGYRNDYTGIYENLNHTPLELIAEGLGTYLFGYIALGITFSVILFNKLKQPVPQNQVEDGNIIEEEVITDELLLMLVADLNQNINNQKKTRIGKSNENDIKNLLFRICKTKEISIKLLQLYHSNYEKDLVFELQSLTASYDGKKSYLQQFIDLNIVENKFPHKYLVDMNY